MTARGVRKGSQGGLSGERCRHCSGVLYSKTSLYGSSKGAQHVHVRTENIGRIRARSG